MKTDLYIPALALFIALTFGLIILLFSGVKWVIKKQSENNPIAKRKVNIFIAGIFLWLAATAFIAYSGFLQDFNSLPPHLLVILLPPVLVIAALTFSSKFSGFLERVPPNWLITLQAFRIPVEIVLWMLFLENVIPVQMTFEGRNFDILVGLTAPFVGYFLAKKKEPPYVPLIIWNIIGLGLLFNIVITAILSTPSPFRIFLNEPANTIIADFPMVWLPGFVVPVALALHVFSLKQLYLLRSKKAEMESLRLKEVA